MTRYTSLLPQFISWYNDTHGDDLTVDSPTLMMTLCTSLETWFDWTDQEGTTPSLTDTDWSDGVFTWDDGCFLSKFIYDTNQGG